MNQAFFYVLFGGLIVWRIYRRMRRQKLRPRPIKTQLLLLALGGLCLIVLYLESPIRLLGLVGGILGGAMLGFVGLKLTRFETTEEGHFYKPNILIGAAISLVLLGRFLYHMSALNQAHPDPNWGSMSPNHPSVMNSPLTLLIIGLLYGYYILYNIGLLVHTQDKVPAPSPSSPPSSLPS